MTEIRYKSPPKELCVAITGMGRTCGNPAKHRLNGVDLCGVHAGPINRHRERYDHDLLSLELWSRGAYSNRVRSMTTEELRSRLDEIQGPPHDLSDARKANLRAEEHEIRRELDRR